MTAQLRITAALFAVLAGAAVTSAALGAQTPEDTRRAALLARAQVWHATDVERMNLKIGPTGPDAFAPGETITCTYAGRDLKGRSPKFACRLPDGDELKVKYGGTNGEVYGEVAASRLLWALGFGADRMYSVRVVCHRCPEDIGEISRDNGDRIVAPAAVERKLGRELSDRWSWKELDQPRTSGRGAGTAERDALKLLAVLLQHNDSKPEQQRIVCLDDRNRKDADCAEPLMMISDLGLTFGAADVFNRQPRASVNLSTWAPLPIWKDQPGCVGHLEGSLTGTLKDPAIGESGRRFLAALLSRLSDVQIHDLFEAARVELRPRVPDRGRSGFATGAEWVTAFKNKRAQIIERRCGEESQKED